MMRNLGFSLLELLIVVAIVAILTATAIPAYKEYIVKARILELIQTAQAYKIKIVENLYTENALLQEFNLDTPLVERVTIQTLPGDPNTHLVNVVAKMQTATQKGIGISAADQPLILQLQGREIGEIMSWTCNVAPQYMQYVPAECKNDILL
jgi:prepilin-type N-terminal cleavage/methylation domain-containing protein